MPSAGASVIPVVQVEPSLPGVLIEAVQQTLELSITSSSGFGPDQVHAADAGQVDERLGFDRAEQVLAGNVFGSGGGRWCRHVRTGLKAPCYSGEAP